MVLAAASILLAAASAPRTQGAARDRDEAEIRDVQDPPRREGLRGPVHRGRRRGQCRGLVVEGTRGDRDDIPEPREGIQTQTLRKTPAGWLIAAFQNTNAVPETPFPLGPPAGPAAPPPQH